MNGVFVAESVQSALPDFELPRYQGVKPQGMKTALTGAGNRISRSHTIGDRVVLVIEAKVKRAGHEDTDDGLVYSEQLKVVDMFEVDDPAAGRLLSTVRQSYREADDERHGRRPLLEVPGPSGVNGWTDGSGVVATGGDLADGVLGDELALDPARALVDESLVPAVVVFSDGARTLWPDEFEAGEVCPKAGDRYEDGEGPADYVFVAKVLDAESGEILGEWSDEQESGRLQRLEEGLAAGEELAAVGDEGLSTSGEGSGPVAALVDSQGEIPDPSPPDHAAEVDVPGTFEFSFVDRDAGDVREVLAEISDVALARRLLKAEEAGRGRGLKPRKGVLEMLERHVAKLGGAHPVVSEYAEVARAAAAAVPPLPGEELEPF